jgi:tetratricopeptide (TPR) repeat protein
MRSATVLRLRAEREMSAGQFAEAIATWQELIPMESGYADNHLSLAEALVAEKRLEEAAARLQTAITLKAGIEAHRRLALVYETLGRAADANRVRQMYIERLLQDLRRRAGEI